MSAPVVLDLFCGEGGAGMGYHDARVRGRRRRQRGACGMTLAQPSPDWMDRAACLDYPPELWFPDTSSDADEAVSICSTCPVRAQCLADALDHDERWGVWGGLTERQRARLRPKDPICPRCRERRAEGVWRHCPQCRSEVQAEKHRRYTRRAS